ncbi:MAG TPA: dockerin type I repeat-containing protein [Thermoanaerobaculia bacterium]|nr:dockerin type I repeat-containing protein [Thermoanaerobaculia bacterium]
MQPKVVLLVGFLAALVIRPCLAQPFGRSGDEFRINQSVTGAQREPSVGMDSTGRFFVVWSAPDGGGVGVFGRRFRHNGTAIDADDFRVNSSTTGKQFVPWVAVAPDSSFDALVVYEKDQASGNEAFGRRYDSTGAVSGAFQVGNATAIYYVFPRAAADSSGNFVAVWNQGGSVMGQRYSSAGALLGNAFTAGSESVNGAPRVARAPGGEFVVTWFSADQRISARRYAANGASLGGAFQVNQVSALMLDAAVAMNDSQFVVTWNLQGYSPDIRARLFDTSGAALSDEFAVNQYTTGFREHIDAGMNGNGGFVIVWEDDNDRDGGGGGFKGSVWGRRFNAAANPLAGGEFQINSTTSGDQLYPRIGMHSSGDFVVVWQGNGGAGSYEIYAQRFCHQVAGDADGNGTIDVADVFYIINNLFAGGPAPVRNSDADGNGSTNVADVFYLINYLFAGGPAPQCPDPL